VNQGFYARDINALKVGHVSEDLLNLSGKYFDLSRRQFKTGEIGNLPQQPCVDLRRLLGRRLGSRGRRHERKISQT
jgi:hypothetical protein